jgi:Ca-activated chloride channel family protein
MKPRNIGLVATLAATLLVNSVQGAGMLIADGGLGGVLEIKEHTVEAMINNGIAVTTVTQVFHNTEQRQVEALYTFPVPKGASVSNFSMWINGKEMVGEVLEKKRAREIYNSYKAKRQDPGLLEQVDYKRFEMRIFPINAKADQKVQITYCQELDFDHNWASYVYPLSTVTRKELNADFAEQFSFNIDVESSIPIAAMECPSHEDDMAIVQHEDSYYQASLEVRDGSLAEDIVLAYELKRPKTGLDLLTSRTKGEDGYFQLTITVGDDLIDLAQDVRMMRGEKNESWIPAGMDYVFLVDISGSMNDDGKLRTASNTVGAFINALGKQDRFEVVTFNVKANTLFNDLRKAGKTARTAATNHLDSQRARGGTVLAPALRAAYGYRESARQLNVVIISDGMTEQKERSQLLKIIEDRPLLTKVFCVGIGNEVNRSLLEQLANDTGGLAAFVSHSDNFDRQARAFRRKLTRPAATAVAIDFADVEVYDVTPRVLPDLYHGSPIRVYGRYRSSGDVNVTLDAAIEGRPISAKTPFIFPTRDDNNPEIERMWAWHTLDTLQKQGDRAGSRDGVVDEIIRLGEGHSIATEYTSFLVLENDGEYKRWKIARHNALRVDRDRAAQAEVIARFKNIRDQAVPNLGPGFSDVEPVNINRRAPQVTQATAPIQVQTESANRQRQSRNIQLPSLPSLGGGSGPVGLLFVPAAMLLAYIKRRKEENEMTAEA